MRVPYSRTGLLLVLIVGGIVGGAAVTSFGDASGTVTVDGITEHRPIASDVAFEIRATLNNTGRTNVTKSVALALNGGNASTGTVDETTTTVPAEGTTTITLTAHSGALTPGRYSYELVNGETEPLARGNITLEAPAFAIVDHRAESVVRGETATVAVDVHNRGDFRGMRTVRLGIDRDHDGSFNASEIVTTSAPMISSDGIKYLNLSVETDELDPDTYAYRVEGTENNAAGELTVKQPATFRIRGVETSTNLTRGERFNASISLVNLGDIVGMETLRIDGPIAAMDWNRTVSLRDGESKTIEFTAGTTSLSRGNYSVAFTMANDSRNETLRIRESYLDIADLRGPDSIDVDEELRITATVVNTGDAVANRTVESRIDLNGDDRPETLVGNRSLHLAPGKRTTVEFTLALDDRSRFGEEELLGTHVYGVYSEDANVTNVVVIQDEDETSSSPSSTGDKTDRVSRDVISQEKYGHYYAELSAETQAQVDELSQRQPFAGDLIVTEVLTREEIARQVFGLNVKRNDAFEFTSIDVETQQRIEAEFDAQFASETGDRIESWDELAQERFGSDYESLNDTRKRTVRDRYQEQFDS